MSFEAPLEENEAAFPSAYYPMNEESCAVAVAIVNERVDEQFGHQYLVKYLNGQHQWWSGTAVNKMFSKLLKEFLDQKSRNERTTQVQPRATSSFAQTLAQIAPKISTPPEQRAPAIPEEQRLSRKRSASQKDKQDEPDIPTPPPRRAPAIPEQQRRLSKSGKVAKAKPDCPVTLEGNARYGNFGSDGNREENGESVQNSSLPLIENEAIVEDSAAATTSDKRVQGLTQFFKKMTEMTEGFFRTGLKELKAAQEEFATMECDYEEIVEEKKTLENSLTEVKLETMAAMEVLRKETQEKLAAKDVEMEKLKTEHVETLRAILGGGNYQETDDVICLKRNALRKSRKWKKLSQMLSALNAESDDEEEHEESARNDDGA